ncbi:MAG TPA: protein-L-isoaspartate(D-aspartate) O-methyltransferase [Kofleriaceae bacterium]|nr:protein-L-isoaspartate(D-aspartate) O-methyltransferase [Kofleriaceae bacterium]
MRGALTMLLAIATSCRSPKPADADARKRDAMVRTIEEAGVRDPGVLAAMRAVPRHELVPDAVRELAYEDHPLPIGWNQTISQPYIVALMTELANVARGDRVLEVGTGSGYQAAVLAEIGVQVHSIEIVEPLAKRAAADLARLGYGDRVEVRAGDGYRGWPEQTPFDAVIVTAAPPAVPQPLVDQLKLGGRLIIPVGEGIQELRVIVRTADGTREEPSILVRFVPMTGEAQQRR